MASDTYAPAFSPLAPEPNRLAAGSANRTTHLFTLTAETAQEEAACIARYILNEVTTKRRAYGDFLILTRRKKGLRPLASALEALQIPIEVSGAGAFGDSEEVRQLSQLLQALADPQDGVALVGVLRGPLFGVSDRQLFAFKQAGGYFSLFSEVDEDSSGVADVLQTLRRFHRYTRVLPAGAALERILDDSGILALAATSRGGVEAGDLLHAIDRVRASVESGSTLTQAAESLVDASQESTEIESWPLRPGRPDVVRLMNLHKAKGLEAPVVFLTDPEGGRRFDAEIRILRGTAAKGFLPIVRKKEGSYGRTMLAEPPDWDAHAAEEEKYLVAEENRLLYVAATRVRDQLVIGRSTKKNVGWAGLGAFLSTATELAIPAEVRVAEPAMVDLSAAAASKAAVTLAQRHAAARTASWSARR